MILLNVISLLFVLSILPSTIAFRSENIVIPHDAQPGHIIKKYTYNGQTFNILDIELSDTFVILRNGILMLTSDISHKVGHPFYLVVKEEYQEFTLHDILVIHVKHKKHMLRFDNDLYWGRVSENLPSGTLVKGLEKLFAFGGQNNEVKYSIVSGNDDNSFSIIPSSLNRSVVVAVVTNHPLDRERQAIYKLLLRAADELEIDSAETVLFISVLDMNDNPPIPEKYIYKYHVPRNTKRFSVIGTIRATDKDGDRPIYHFQTRHPKLTIIPQTGEILLTGTLDQETYKLFIKIHDNRNPRKYSQSIPLIITTSKSDPFIRATTLLDVTENDTQHLVRAKRSVRATKSYEYKESDGSIVHKIMFQLEKEHPKEVFEVESPNRWVQVDKAGVIRVKEPWNYEHLGKEKTIDFWVLISKPGASERERERIIIHIQDVNDEPPYFINRPLPLQAVVQLNAVPGTSVFKLQARDPDTDHNIHYVLVRDRTGGRFEVDERSGEVRTRGKEPFMLDKEYVLYIKAEDRNGKISQYKYQSTPEMRLSIMGGKRAPQFYMEKYETSIPENQKKDSDVIEVKAKSFADRLIRYTLRAKGSGAGTFNIDSSVGIVKLAKDLDYEDLRQPQTYFLVVTATEDSGGFSTSVDLTITVHDVNDNPPRFELPDYQAHNVDEDIPQGTSVLQVSASDMDSDKNAEITYTIESQVFTIDNRGIIYSNKRLDADVNNTYEFTVEAIDHGDPQLTGTATVRIYTENKNDEFPKFSQDVYTPNVDENAGPNTLVTTVVASDKDGDNIHFGFVGGGTVSGMFQIEERTGVIRLISGSIQLDKDKYELNVTAQDDGSCCKDGSLTPHTSTALVVVFITDVNDNKPTFEECDTYSPTVKEGAASGTTVITVKASDKDKGHNGLVRYSIVKQPNQKGTKFLVDEVSGVVKTNKVFDREGEDGRFVSLTVKATDRGNPPLEGACSFKVEITDINDNPPLFDRHEYKEHVKQDTPVGTSLLRMSASDEDADNNGAVVYNLTSSHNPLDLSYFTVNPDSGWVILQKPLDRQQYNLRAVALDKGKPQNKATVELTIEVVNRNSNPPVWDQPVYGPIAIKENIRLGEVVTSIKAK
ncbi:neural-cadherin-like [Limulus polyphemus]|uniref:Neural-cadherin-like n=1 Tax=Limulus polyphemus TaxID=6850 RepID=A0ABM1S4M3_LIMPO|nr:neural-cadherin-like [Limulus polyphemus]